MGLSDTLGNFYMKAEDAYYGILDFFEEKGIGLPWAYNDFLETKGVPAMPFTAGLLILLLSILFFASTAISSQDVSLTLSLKDEKGLSLSDVTVRIYDGDGKLLKEMTASDGQTITLSGILPASELKITATKQGYGEKTSYFNPDTENLKLLLKGDNEAIVGKLRLIDGETGTTIKDATITAEWVGGGSILTTYPGGDGIALLNVPLNQEITLSIKATNYEDLHDFITFTSGDVKTKEMTPKAGASNGPSLLEIKVVDAKTQFPLSDVHITIENAQTNEIITDVDTGTGTHAEQLPKGHVVRVTVKKENYVTFSSESIYPGGKTLRNDTETMLIPLQNGGVNLVVLTQNGNSTQPLDGVDVDVLDASYARIDHETSNFSGEVIFGGLNQVNTYYLLGFHPNFFPTRASVDWTQLQIEDDSAVMTLNLTPFTSGSAGILTVFVNESNGAAAPSASVSIDEEVDGQFLPLVSGKPTDAAGSFTSRIQTGKTIRVRAEKGDESAEQQIQIIPGLNKVILTLSDGLHGVTLNAHYLNGNPFIGTITIEDTGGNTFAEEHTTSGIIEFVSTTPNDTINMHAESDDGKTFTQTISIAGKTQLEWVLDDVATASGNAPTITYMGLFTPNGEAAPGISPEQDVFARFSVAWPSGMNKGGLLVRTGPDTMGNVDSQYVGIVGVNGESGFITYGKTWTPLPKPGNEAKDRKTVASPNTLAKWVEITRMNPTGTSTFDIRLRAREGSPAGLYELHYRAFTLNVTQTFRTPNDTELGTSSFVSTKSGLYAETLSTGVPVFDAQPFCQNGICAVISLIDEDARSFDAGAFQAVAQKPYALQVTLLPSLIQGSQSLSTSTIPKEGLIANTELQPALNGTVIKAQTDPDEPLIVFTKTEVNTFGKIENNGNKDTSISVNIPAVSGTNGTQARVHFYTEEVGDASITLQIISNNAQLSQTIPFPIVEAQLLRVTLPDHVNPNESFLLTITDEEGTPITDALITLTSITGEFAGSIKGKNTLNKGESGKYLFNKPLSPGFYHVKVKVPGFVDFEDTLNVGIDSPLSMNEKNAIHISYGQMQATQNIVLTNKTNQPVTNVTGEFLEYDLFPKDILIEVGIIPVIPANGKGDLVIIAHYTGNAEDTSVLSGAGKLKVRGEINDAFPVETEGQLEATYNKQLDSSCLTFDKERVSVVLSGETQPYGNMYGTGGAYNPTPSYYGNNAVPNQYNYLSNGYNNLGYDDQGYYQNAENKRVSVKAKNNCGEELILIPGISTQGGQLEVDGLKIAAVDSQLRLGNGQERQVDFTLSNRLFRAGFVPAQANYALMFKAPQLTASLPLDIIFQDKSKSLQTPLSVTLNLVKAGNTKATDRVSVPITNIGASLIYDIRGTLEGDKIEGVTLKLENNHSSSTSTSGNDTYAGGYYQTGYYSQDSALSPGQTLYPPLAIIGESTTDKAELGSQRLVLTGVVDGKRIQLKTVDVYIQTGATSCLEVSAFNTPISFVSSQIQGTLSKRITVSNKCLEPVRITQVNPDNASGNTLGITPVEFSDTLEKDEEREFNITLNKSNPYKATFPIRVKGIMILSQKAVESNPINIEIALGENELESTQSSNAIEVPYCEGGMAQIKFPQLAQKNECSQAYCDAEQAANMLSTLIEQHIAKAAQQLQSKKNDASLFKNCDLTQHYCTFEQLGIKSSSIDLYLQHDVITPNLLEFVMKDGTYPRLSGMQTETLTSLGGDDADAGFEARLGTTLGNKIFLPEIQGCGKYRIAIIGSVEVVGNQLQPDAINVAVKLISPRQKTAECADKIYNAANFLPKDRSLTALNNKQTLLGVVKYPIALEEAAQWLAETVFGTKDRAIQNTGSNRMDLQIGKLTQSVVELTLDPATHGDGTKRIITTIRGSGSDIPKAAVIEAGKIITSLGKNVNGCITKDEQTWRISAVKDVGKFTFEGCALPGTKEGGLIVRPNPTCCELSTRSTEVSEATYSLEPNGNDPMPGLLTLNLYEKKGSNTDGAIPGDQLTIGSPYALPFDTKEQVYQKDILLCATANAETQHLANKMTIQTSATRLLDNTKAGPLTFELRTCTMDADDALAKAYEKGTGVWYATIDWDDPVSSKTLKQAVTEAANGKKAGDAFFAYQGQGILASDDPVYQEKFKGKQQAAMAWFGGTCIASCLACHGVAAVFTLGTTLPAAAVDCGITCGVGTGIGFYELNKEKADGIPVLENIVDATETIYGVPRDFATSPLDQSMEMEPANSSLFAAETTNLIKAIKSPIPVKKLTYVDPKAAIDQAHLAFLKEVDESVAKKIVNNTKVADEYLSKWTSKQVKVGKIKVPAPPDPPIRTQLANKIELFDAEKQKIADGFANLKTKYSANPNFNVAEFEQLEKRAQASLRILTSEYDETLNGLKNNIINGKNTLLRTGPIDVAKNSIKKAVTEAADKAGKITVPEKFIQTKAVKKTTGFLRGLVCGGIGGVAGYAAYRSDLSDEIENKISLGAESVNVIDPVSNNIVFEKGHTYKFVVSPGEGEGKSEKISIDILSPDQRVPAAAWLDDCSPK
ncbi:MAG: carboxypeptidase-like regulatory domain-containing protein [Candidatus Diapherotrites archaeon]